MFITILLHAGLKETEKRFFLFLKYSHYLLLGKISRKMKYLLEMLVKYYETFKRI